MWTGLHALDGVDLLYSGSRRITQTGDAVDLRAGALKEWPGERGARSLETIVFHNSFATTHDVLYADQVWDPGQQLFIQQARTDTNYDHTNTWGAQLQYEIPLATPGWRIGWLATANRVSQPNVPNDDVLSIPRNPGHVNAYELGAGVSRTYGSSLFGMDLVYQPAWSTTSDTAFENDFRFSNAVFRMGVSHDVLPVRLEKTLAVQLGLMVRDWTRQGAGPGAIRCGRDLRADSQSHVGGCIRSDRHVQRRHHRPGRQDDRKPLLVFERPPAHRRRA